MGTSLADALADYRNQLAPTSEDGTRPRRWRWWVLLALTVGVLVLGGALALTRPGDSTPTPADPVAGTTDPDPATVTPATPTPPPATAGAAGPLAVAPGAGWVPWQSPVVRTWLPRIPGAGPADAPATGFARTPQGALAAAATLYMLAYYESPQAAWTTVADTRVQWAPGQREQLADALVPVWAAGVPEPMQVTPVGYRVVVEDADRARFRLWWDVDFPDGRSATVGALINVVWADGDWQLLFDESTMDLRGLAPTDTYLAWGPR